MPEHDHHRWPGQRAGAYPDAASSSWPLLWLLLTVTAILYGSLLPFDLQWRMIGHPHPAGLQPFALRAAAIDDIVANVLIYVPIGWAVMFCGARPRRLACRLVLAAVLGALVSLGAEGLQTRAAMRVASCTDVFLNAIGALMGAFTGIGLRSAAPLVKSKILRCLRRRRYASLATMLAAAIVLLELAPFDFVTSTAAMHEAFLRSRWDVIVPRATSVGEPPLSALVEQLSGAACFAALAYLLALANRETPRHQIVSLFCAVKHGVILAGLIELLQLFTVSHVFDLAALMLRVLAVTLGAWSASFTYAEPPLDPSREEPRLGVPMVVPVCAVIVQSVCLFLYYFDPTTFSVARLEFDRITWLPFEAVWHRSLAHGVTSLAATFTAYAALALSVNLILLRRGAPLRRRAVLVLTIGCAILVEGIGLACGHHLADVTNLLLALLGAMSVSRWVDWVKVPAGNQPTVPPDRQPRNPFAAPKRAVSPLN